MQPAAGAASSRSVCTVLTGGGWPTRAIGGHPVALWLGVRRFFCGNNECKAVTFAEQFEGLTTPRARRTPPLARMLTSIGVALAGRAGTGSPPGWTCRPAGPACCAWSWRSPTPGRHRDHLGNR